MNNKDYNKFVFAEAFIIVLTIAIVFAVALHYHVK